MAKFFLTRLRVEGFRGINNESDPLDLRFTSDAVNSVYGPNGIGKSSIFEALCYAIRGEVPKLSALLPQEKPDEYICNAFHSTGSARIELTLTPDDASSEVTLLVCRDRSGARTVTSPSGHPAPDALLESLNEEFALLDYNRFAHFIDSTPLERGRSFSSLLGLSRYSDFRQALQTVSETRALNSDLGLTTLRSELSNAASNAQSALRRLGASYEGLTGQPLADAGRLSEYATNVLAALRGIPLLQSLVAEQTLEDLDFVALKAAIGEAEGGPHRKELAKVIELLTQLSGVGAPDTSVLSEEHNQLRRLITEADALLRTTKGNAFKRLFEAAQALLRDGQWLVSDACPLCERGGLGLPIETIIAQQLDHFEAVAAKLGELEDAIRKSSWLARMQMIQRILEPQQPAQGQKSPSMAELASSGELRIVQLEDALTAWQGLEARLSNEIGRVRVRREELEKSLPPSLVRLTEQVSHANQFRDAFKEHQEQSAKHSVANARLELRMRWQTFICNTARAFGEAETALARGRLSAIDADYKALFASIMIVQDVVPALTRAQQRQELNVQLSDFHGLTGVSARALLSESYRNALAISVFLSAAMKHAGVPRFVVLDDVTSSFDAGHQWYLMEAIRTHLQHPRNPDGLQFILLSHDGLLEKYFDKLGNTPGWHHQKLQGWPPLGAVMTQTQDANRLRHTATQLLSAGQIREAEPLVRQYLEFKLLQIISKVRIPVPLDFAIKDHMRMVSNCLDAMQAATDLHSKAGTLILQPAQLIDFGAVHVPALIGNWVNHYETGSQASLAPPVLLGVLNTIDNLTECFRFDDTSSGATVRRWYKSLSSRH